MLPILPQIAEKLPPAAIGAGGISLALFTVASYAQAVGVIVGAVIVCIQFYRILRGIFKKKPPQ